MSAPLPPGKTPPPQPERLVPIVLPAGAPAHSPAPPAGAPTRSPALLLAVCITAILGLIANTIGWVGFPPDAPLERIYAFGINVDLIVVALVCGFGAYLSRRGYPLRASTPVTTFAVACAAASVVVWLLAGGLGSIIGLAVGNGRYIYASGGLFYGGALWVLALAFGSHGYRRRGSRRNNVLAIVALAVPGVLVLFAIVSSVLFGLGLTN